MHNKRNQPEVIVQIVTLPTDDDALVPDWSGDPEASAMTVEEILDELKQVDPDFLDDLQGALYKHLWGAEGVLYLRNETNPEM